MRESPLFGVPDRSSDAGRHPDQVPKQEHVPEDMAEQETLKRMSRQEQKEFDCAERNLADALQPTVGDRWVEFDPPFMRLLYLGGALKIFQRYSDRLPRRCEMHFQQVMQKADELKRIFAEYPSRRANSPDGHYNTADAETIVEAHIQLRRLNPDAFPRELVDESDKEFSRVLTRPWSKDVKPWQPLMHEAKLAEYNPDAFGRVARKFYPPEVIQRDRLRWERYPDHQPECREAWAVVERTLQLDQEGRN
jgi:hypothetical protein